MVHLTVLLSIQWRSPDYLINDLQATAYPFRTQALVGSHQKHRNCSPAETKRARLYPCTCGIDFIVPLVLYNIGGFYQFLLCNHFQPNLYNYSNWRTEFSKSAFDKSTSYSPCCFIHTPTGSYSHLNSQCFCLVHCLPCFFFLNILEHRNMLCYFSHHVCQRLHRDTLQHDCYSYITWQSRQDSSKEEWSWICNNSNNQQGLNISVVSLTVNFINCSLTVMSFLSS